LCCMRQDDAELRNSSTACMLMPLRFLAVHCSDALHVQVAIM
jgi:hypothetical protein